MKYSIENIAWIDCIFIPMDWAHSVTTRVLVKAWSDYETDREWWISHFLEHLSMNWWKNGKNDMNWKILLGTCDEKLMQILLPIKQHIM